MIAKCSDTAAWSADFQLDPALQYVIFEGRRWSAADRFLIKDRAFAEQDESLKAFWSFLDEWFSEQPTMNVQSSGSTGQPKHYAVRKDRMMNSACRTCLALGLRAGYRLLLCMDLRYIGAKMMIVRALVAGMEIIVQKPSAHPLAQLEQPVDFISVVPLQLYRTLQVPEERKKLERSRLVLVGGGAIDKSLWEKVRTLSCQVYSSYGMTETLSHIALCHLQDDLQVLTGNTEEDFHLLYTPLPGVGVGQTEEGCLTVNVPDLCDELLVTNDLVELRSDGSFWVLGRKDNVVNSGGVKIHLEKDESRLAHLLGNRKFALTSVPDPALGEALVLLVVATQEEADALAFSLKQCLPRYHAPCYVFSVEEIPATGSGKIARAACRILAGQELKKRRAVE